MTGLAQTPPSGSNPPSFIRHPHPEWAEHNTQKRILRYPEKTDIVQVDEERSLVILWPRLSQSGDEKRQKIVPYSDS
jgi:hypothetical protein